MNRLGLIAAMVACGACSQGEPELVLECNGACDQVPPALLGIESAPEAVRCDVADDVSELRCELVLDHPAIEVDSVSLQVDTDTLTRPSGAVLSRATPVAHMPIPLAASSVGIVARYNLADGSALLGVDALGTPRAEAAITLGVGTSRASLAVPIDIWRLELLGYSEATFDLLAGQTVLGEDLNVLAGAREPMAIAVAPGTDELQWIGRIAGEQASGTIDAATVLAITPEGIAPATAEQIPETPKGAVALACAYEADDPGIRCAVPDGAGEVVGKIAVSIYGADGSFSRFTVAPRFSTKIVVSEDQLPVTIIASTEIDLDVFGLPLNRRNVELRGAVDAEQGFDFRLPFDLFTVDVSSEVDVAGLIIDSLPLELGMAMPGFFEFEGDALEVSMPRSVESVRIHMAVPPGVDTMRATLRLVDGIDALETSAELVSGESYLILGSGLATVL